MERVREIAEALTLHLSEHHGDCCPGSTVFVCMTWIEDFHKEIMSRGGYNYNKPGSDVVRLAEKHKVLHRLLFIGRTITEPKLREHIKSTSARAHIAAVANNAEEFSAAIAAPDADWAYVRFLPTTKQIEAVHRADKKSFIAGPTVSGDVPKNWHHCTDVGMDGILTDYPLALRTALNRQSE